MTLADPLAAAPARPDPAPARGLRPQRGISAAVQARLDAGLMRGRLPWPAAVYLVCVVAPVWFNLGPLAMSLLRLYLLVLIVPVMLRLLAGHYGRTIATDWLFLAHTLWIGVSLAVTTPQQAVTQLGSVGLEFLGGYAVARAFIRTPETFLALCRWLVAAVVLLLPPALVEAVTARALLIEAVRALPGINSVTLGPPDPRLGLYRAQVVFPHAILFGLFCSIAFALSFVALKGVVSTGRRWITSVLVAFACFLSVSSGALLAIMLQIGLIVWAALFDRLRWRWWLLAGLGVLAYIVLDLLSNRTPIQVFMSYAAFSPHNAFMRSIIFDWGLDNVIGHAERGIPASPWVGIGMNDWIRPEWMVSASVDNFWLLTTMRYGLPGLFLLVLGYVLVIARVMRRDFAADPVLAQIRRAWVFTFLGLSFTLCTVHVWGNAYSFVFFLFGAGVWLIGAQPAAAAAPAAVVQAGRAPAGPRYSRFAPAPPRNPLPQPRHA